VSMDAQILKEGWLVKRGRLVKNWKKRYAYSTYIRVL
jgi:hypothetical protein